MWHHGLGALHEDACHLGPNVPRQSGSQAVWNGEQPPACDPVPVVRLKQLDV